MKRFLDPGWAGRRLARQVLTALAFSLIAIALRWTVSPWLGEHHEFLPGYAAVAAATWVATWRAGVIVAAISVIALQSPLFRPVQATILSAELQSAASAVAFVCVAGLLVYLAQRASQRMHALSDQVMRLDAADHRKSEFLALIAHELRNPLSAISAGTRLFRSEGLDKRSLQGTWEMMERQTDHMKRLIGDLLDVARIEQGKVTLQRENVSVSDLIKHAIADSISYTSARRQTILSYIEADPGEAYVDALRIGQVLGNLLHNASKFSPEGAAISVRVRSCDDDVTIAVQDQGIGIPKTELHSIFESFVQLEPCSGGPQGLGLGLALCRKLIQMHDGSIEARSAGRGHGAEFLIRFPRARAQEPATSTGSAPGDFANTVPLANEAAACPLRLLVVDDNRDAAESLALLLQLRGHTAFTANDGQSALKAAAQERPDFVFLDIGLPDMTGHEVALELRQQVRGKQPIVVALTGWGSADDVQRSRRNGFDGHLTKPISLEQIDAALSLTRRTDETRGAAGVPGLRGNAPAGTSSPA